VLKRSVAKLGAIGRTLNQIARVANQSGKGRAQDAKTFERCSKWRSDFETT